VGAVAKRAQGRSQAPNPKRFKREGPRVTAAPSPVRIAVMARAPVAGFAKTRLIPALGEAGAAALALRLLQHAVQQAVAARLGAVTLWATPDASHPAFLQAQQQHGVALAVQGEGDVGQRMRHVFEQSFATAPGAVLLMGTDIPGLRSDVLQSAAAALQKANAVLVPALDGGYALIGLHAAAPSLFNNMLWSTAQVLAQTRLRLAAAGLRYVELPALADIDEPDDLQHLPPNWLPASDGRPLLAPQGVSKPGPQR
jgi:uncharacterized protein